MKTLNEIALPHDTDKSTKLHGYLSRYEPLFNLLKDSVPAGKAMRILEVGIATGGSLLTWLEYFHDAFEPQIYGVDINEDFIQRMTGKYPGITPVLGDGKRADFWASFRAQYGSDFDLIIDDATHFSKDIILTFESVWPMVRPGGYYLCEDLHTTYHVPYTETGCISATDYFKALIDKMNDRGDLMQGNQRPGNPYDWIHFSKSFVIIKKMA